MDQFLYELAMMKYQMWHEMFKFKPFSSTNQECFERIQYKSKYEQLLTVINLLPLEHSKKLLEIESEYFSDAPYVHK